MTMAGIQNDAAAVVAVMVVTTPTATVAADDPNSEVCAGTAAAAAAATTETVEEMEGTGRLTNCDRETKDEDTTTDNDDEDNETENKHNDDETNQQNEDASGKTSSTEPIQMDTPLPNHAPGTHEPVSAAVAVVEVIDIDSVPKTARSFATTHSPTTTTTTTTTPERPERPTLFDRSLEEEERTEKNDDDDDNDSNNSTNQDRNHTKEEIHGAETEPWVAGGNDDKEDDTDAASSPPPRATTTKKEEDTTTTTPANSTRTTRELVFENYLELQTRLVLIPSVDEEGTGARVAAYPEDPTVAAAGFLLVAVNNDDIEDNQDKHATTPSLDYRTAEFTDILATLRQQGKASALRLRLEPRPSQQNTLEEAERNEDITTTTTITSTDGTPEENTTEWISNDDHKEATRETSRTSLKSGMSVLSAWGSRMKAQSEKFAIEARSSVALAVQATSQQQQQQQKQREQEHVTATAKAQLLDGTPSVPAAAASLSSGLVCEMYLRTEMGEYVPLSVKQDNTAHVESVSTSSLVSIRKSATEPVLRSVHTAPYYAFQWYHSSSNKLQPNGHSMMSPSQLYEEEKDASVSVGGNESVCSSSSVSASSSSSSVSSSSLYSRKSRHTTSSSRASLTSTVPTTQRTKDEDEWIPLLGATEASFQPNTTLVGKMLRCVVTICSGRTPPIPKTMATTTASSSRSNNESICYDENGKAAASASSVSSVSSSSKDSSSFSNGSAGSDINNADKSSREKGYTVDDGGHHTAVDTTEESIVVCESIVPIESDEVLFNGAKQAMIQHGSAKFGNLIGRGNTNENEFACGKTFRIEVSTARKIVPYCTVVDGSGTAVATAATTAAVAKAGDMVSLSSSSSSSCQRKQSRIETKRTINVNSVHVYCRLFPQEEYELLTDIPLLQVTAVANPIDSRQFDLLFPALPSNYDRNHDDDVSTPCSTTHQFLKEYCVSDYELPSTRKIPRLKLEAPNRMTRESFLLSLGIANYEGKLKDLNHRKVLYRDDVQVECQWQQQVVIPSPLATTIATSAVGMTTSSNSAKIGSSIFVSSLPPPPSQQSSGFVNKDDDSHSTSSGGPSLSFPSSHSKNNIDASDSDGDGDTDHNHEDCIDNLTPLSPVVSLSCKSTAPTSFSDGTSMLPPNDTLQQQRQQMHEMQHEMDLLRAQLTRKDRLVTDLQRQVEKFGIAHHNTRQSLKSAQHQLKESQQDCERVLSSKRHIERSMQSHREATQRAESDHEVVVKEFANRIKERDEKISEMEKQNRVLRNEKAVLGASVEARESRLIKMDHLQAKNTELTQRISQQDIILSQMEELQHRNESLLKELESKKKSEVSYQKELDAVLDTVENSKTLVRREKDIASSCKTQLEIIEKKNQQLKGERNSYKQKNQSLSKEVARLCRGGRNINDIDKMLDDHDALLQEMELLRVQKRKALEDAHLYRTSYEQLKAAEEMSIIKQDTWNAFERTAELERLLTEMTEYVTAKDMQLDTIKLVNKTLQEEIHNLAKAHLKSNEV